MATRKVSVFPTEGLRQRALRAGEARQDQENPSGTCPETVLGNISPSVMSTTASNAGLELSSEHPQPSCGGLGGGAGRKDGRFDKGAVLETDRRPRSPPVSSGRPQSPPVATVCILRPPPRGPFTPLLFSLSPLVAPVPRSPPFAPAAAEFQPISSGRICGNPREAASLGKI